MKHPLIISSRSSLWALPISYKYVARITKLFGLGMLGTPLLATSLLVSLLFSVPAYAQPVAPAKAETEAPPKTIDEVLGLVKQYCGSCHHIPPPSVLPKHSWPRVVQAMADIAVERTGHEVIPADAIRDITAYYYGSSPENLPRLPYIPGPHSALQFTKSDLGEKSTLALILNVNSVSLTNSKSPEFLVSDAAHKQLRLIQKQGGKWQETVLADIEIPISSDVVDFDGDGRMDILVADLGIFPAFQSHAGKVILLRQTKPGVFTKEVILENVGRVTDARAVDIDGDGDLDIAVAIFGAGAQGELAWLENLGNQKFLKHRLLKGSGALNITPVDLNNDGKMDFVSLISQEFEAVVAFINQGEGKFTHQVLAKAPHPMFGSTSMQVVDLDGDGDMDIVFTNGDALDLQTDPKPYHGVQWLENKGNLKFQYHNIGRFYGAAIAAIGDIDGDGDLDIVVGSWLNDWADEERQSLIWFENDGKQNFTPHRITSTPQGIVSIALEDLNNDGRLDIIAGVFQLDLMLESLKDDDPEATAADKTASDKTASDKTNIDKAATDTTAAEKPAPRVPSSRVLLLENKAILQAH